MINREQSLGAQAHDRVQSARRTKTHAHRQIIATSGISLRLWRLYAYFWLVCLAFPTVALVQLHPAPLQLFLALTGLALFVICYVWIMWPHPLQRGAQARMSPTRVLMLLAALTVLVLMLSLSIDGAFLWLFIGVGAIAGVMLPARSGFIAVMLLTLLTLGVAVTLGGGLRKADWLQIIPLALLVRGLGLDMLGLARLANTLQELQAARGELARLAVIEERQRLARDLHDLLGQTLSAITLKSELAARLVEHAPAQAVEEMLAIERLARQTLRDVREAVGGYRQPALQSELDGARELLQAAGITWTVEHTAGTLPPPIDTVLAWVVREGVTNVLRHSRARWCSVRVTRENDTIRAEVTNDDVLAQPADQPGSVQHTGSGLAGLAERAGVLGGRVAAEPWQTGAQAGFRLQAELPSQGTAAEQE